MKNTIKNKLPQVQKICGEHFVKSLWLFGSVTTAGFTTQSDIDLLVEFQPKNWDKDYGDYADNYLELLTSFEDLFKRKVDLVTVKPDMNPYFLKIIENQKVQIYG